MIAMSATTQAQVSSAWRCIVAIVWLEAILFGGVQVAWLHSANAVESFATLLFTCLVGMMPMTVMLLNADETPQDLSVTIEPYTTTRARET